MDDVLIALLVIVFMVVCLSSGLAIGQTTGKRLGRIEVFTGEYICEQLKDNSVYCFNKDRLKN